MFESMVSKISTRFINTKDMDKAIHMSLEDIGKYSHADRSYIFIIKENNIMDNIYEWCSEGTTPEIDNLKGLSTDIFPWWMEKLIKKEIILVSNVADMEEEAEAEKIILLEQGIVSVAVLPIYVHQKLYGFIGLDNVVTQAEWSHEDINLLQLMSEIFSNALERMQMERELKKNNEELKEAIIRLKETQSKLIQQENLAGIGQLAAGIAHEINNPLAFIISNSSILHKYFSNIRKYITEEEATPLVEEVEDTLLDIQDGLKRVDTIVKSLSAFSRNDQTMIPFDLNQGISNTLTIAKNEYKYYAEIITNLNNLPTLKCIPGQINQVLLNLLLNAIYSIKKKYGKGFKKGIIHFNTYHDSNYVYCEIGDNGEGIAKVKLPKIYNPFYTTKPVGEGTGLGLSIVYDIIVNKHQGTIDVVSEEGIGTTFIIKLPIVMNLQEEV